MLYCSAHQVGIAVHDDWLFRDVTVEVQHTDRLAVIGPNGSGKTTLMKLLTGELEPDEGTVARKRDIRIGSLDQMPRYPVGTTVEQVLYGAFAELEAMEARLRELESAMALEQSTERLDRVLDEYALTLELFEERGGYVRDSKVRSVMDGLRVPADFLSSAFASLSGGEQSKVAFARLLLSEPDLLLLDEPTNHLDLPSIEWLEGFLGSYRGAVVVVSHDRRLLDHVATRVLELDSGEAALYQGGYSAAIQQREEKLLLDFQAYQEQQKKIQQMTAAIRRLRDWANRSNPPSAGLHRRATNIQRALDRIQRFRRPKLERERMALTFDMQGRSGKDVVSMSGIRKSFGAKCVIDDVTLGVRYGERVALVGMNGSGKSTLLNIMIGEETADCGHIRVGDSVSVGVLNQQGLIGYDGSTVLDAFRDVVPVTEGEARRLLARLLFYGEAVFKKVKNLSGGERMRLRFAQLMYQGSNLLVLDEPTNHLDIESREVLEDALEEYEGTVIAVSHDRHFINRLFYRVLWLENGRATDYLGNYDDARAKRQLTGGAAPENS